MEDQQLHTQANETDFLNISEAIKKAAQTKEELNLSKVNGMIIGITGVGKSSLINAFFMDHVAEESVGARGTITFDNYENKVNGFTLIDTRGFELDNTEIDTFQLVRNKINDLNSNSKKEEQLHFVWYAILNSHRINDCEIELIKWIKSKEIPCIVVLTQTFNNEESVLEKFIKKELFNVPVVRVMAKTKKLVRDLKIRPFGLDILL